MSNPEHDPASAGEKILIVEQILLMKPDSSLNVNNKSGATVTDPTDATTVYFDTDRNRMTYSSSVTGGKTEIMTSMFDAVVANDGGDYTSVAAAFADGKKSVFVRTGTYIETNDIIIPSAGRLIGESIAKAMIVLAAGNSVRIEDTTRETTTGTISITSGTSTVTGIGTDFQIAGITTGDYILLGTKYYPVTSVTDDTTLILDDPYRGSDLVNEAYRAHKMNVAAQVQNVVIYGSSGPGLYLNRAYHTIIEDVLLSTCTPNLYIDDSGSIMVKSICSQNASSDGLYLSNTHTVNITSTEFKNNLGHGISIANQTSNIIVESSGVCNNTGSGINIDGSADFLTITDLIILHNGDHGIITSSTSEACAVSDCNISSNGLTGITFDGQSNCASNCIIKNNGSHGIDAGNKVNIVSCQIMGNVGDGIMVSGVRSTLTGNCIQNNTGNGINITSNQLIANSNQIHDNTGHGILVTSDNCIITSSQIHDNTGDGINLGVLATGNKIALNILSGNANAIVDSGTGNLLLNN